MSQQNFQFKAIDAQEVRHLINLASDKLLALGARRMTVDQKPGFPCRVSLQDAEVGEEVILFPYAHHAVDSPYQSSGPIFVRTQAATANVPINTIPLMVQHRLLSVRAYDQEGMMRQAKTLEGQHLAQAITELFAKANIHYLHIHNAGPGCYNCRVERIS